MGDDMTAKTNISYAKDLMNFIDKSPSPYHAVDTVKTILKAKGFREIHEQDEWKIEKNDKVFVTKNYSTIMALAIGGQYKPGNGVSLIGAHTDSPCLKLKPNSCQSNGLYTKLGVETYGGGIWYTWFDRDLTLAGRAIVRDGDVIRHKLINLEKPVARVPSIAIHLERTINESFSPNKETQLCPILSTQLLDEENDTNNCEGLKHPKSLMKKIAEHLSVEAEDIIDMELCFADTQPSALGGIHEEFVYAPRLDNLFNCHASILAMLDTLPSLDQDSNIRAVCLFDNEEVGSQSAQGAMSAFTEHTLRRVVSSLSTQNQGNFEQVIANSLLLSADQAHAIHPNYEEKHEKNHRPQMHYGVVLKVNSNQRYASTAITQSVLREVANKASVPLQDFVVRQDMGCGSTIGPIMAASLGIQTVDVGCPQLSMHSCREMTDTSSSMYAVQLFAGFFEYYPSISRSMRSGHA